MTCRSSERQVIFLLERKMNIFILLIAFSAAALLTGADQLIKYWAVENLSGMRWVLLGITSLLMIFCIYYLIKHKKELLTVISMTLIISGGFGNIIDRLFRGGLVVDYLDVQLFDFAIFNFADCCVVVGVVLLLIQILFFDKSTSQKNKNESVQTDE